jgi:hypothetical protein
MNKRQIATIVFGGVGVLEVGDFVANVTLITSPSRLDEVAIMMGISLEQQFVRAVVLTIVAFIIAVLCFAAAWGFYRNLVLKTAYRWAAGSLIAYSIFHFVTAITLPAATFSWWMALGCAIGAILLYLIGRWAA